MNAAAPHAAELVRVYDRINELQEQLAVLAERCASLEACVRDLGERSRRG